MFDNTDYALTYLAVLAVATVVTYIVFYKKRPAFVMVDGKFAYDKATLYALGVGVGVVFVLWAVLKMFRRSQYTPLNMRRPYYIA